MSSFVTQRVSWSETGCIWVLTYPGFAGGAEKDDRLQSELESAFRSLSDNDRVRCERYRRSEKKVQFLLSRLAIANVLLEEFGRDHRLIWESRSDGCPVLVDPSGQRVASVSLSHSQNIFVIGLDSPWYRVGVDCEVIEHVSPAAVFRFLGHGIADDVRDADEWNQRWQAAMCWTQFEAEWKALQNGNILEKYDIRTGNVLKTDNCSSDGVPPKGGPLRSHLFRVGLVPHFDRETMEKSATSLFLQGPDASICVAYESFYRVGVLGDLQKDRPLVCCDGSSTEE